MAAIAFAIFDMNALVLKQRVTVDVENRILREIIVHFEVGTVDALSGTLGTASPAKSNLSIP